MTDYIFPARVGMNPRALVAHDGATNFPRASGDEPCVIR